jgi:predicted aspartyl protease
VSLIYPYVRFAARQPLPSLGGALFRPRPVIAVTVIGPVGSAALDCLVDTGADDTVFPDNIAIRIGLDLSNAPTFSAAGVGLVASNIRFALVRLRLVRASEQREWQAWVGFTSAPLRQPLLGFAGFLQYFTATFHGDAEKLELTVNATYPGTGP